MTSCSDIDRLLATRSNTAKEALDLAVRKASETQKALERFKSYTNDDPRSTSKYDRVAENFGKVTKKIESAMKRYQESIASKSEPSGTKMQPMNHRVSGFSESNSNYYPPHNYDYISSMEEGNRGQTLEELKRINRDMTSLQDIYVSLSETASNQGSLLDSVQDKLNTVGRSASSAVQELNKAKERLDYWTKIKLYAVSGIAAVGFVVWLI
jgi:t-SNARE complex subunit (syntaxin)